MLNHINSRYTSKDSATRAICGVHGTEINGSIVKCSWGKEQAELQQQIANSQQLKSASIAAATSQAGVRYLEFSVDDYDDCGSNANMVMIMSLGFCLLFIKVSVNVLFITSFMC